MAECRLKMKLREIEELIAKYEHIISKNGYNESFWKRQIELLENDKKDILNKIVWQQALERIWIKTNKNS
jgi:hypothetical protein